MSFIKAKNNSRALEVPTDCHYAESKEFSAANSNFTNLRNHARKVFLVNMSSPALSSPFLPAHLIARPSKVVPERLIEMFPANDVTILEASMII
jgi:hypothetical protein